MKQNNAKIKTLIASGIQEVLEDPDFNLELTIQAKRRLKAARFSRSKTTSLRALKKKLNIK